MSAGVTTLFGAVGAVAALLAVLLPVILTQGSSLRRELDTLRADVAEVRRDLHALAGRVDAVSDRVVRIEGALTGPWRAPANGTPSPAPSPPPEATT